jgi:glucan biosynthesis protein
MVMKTKTTKDKTMQRYFECYGINKKGKFDTQYVNFNLVFGTGYQTFEPKKNQLKKHSSFKSISYFRVVDGEPIYNDKNELIRVQY